MMSDTNTVGLKTSRSLSQVLREFADFLDRKAVAGGYDLVPPTVVNPPKLTTEDISQFVLKAHGLMRQHEEGGKTLKAMEDQ